MEQVVIEAEPGTHKEGNSCPALSASCKGAQ